MSLYDLLLSDPAMTILYAVGYGIAAPYIYIAWRLRHDL